MQAAIPRPLIGESDPRPVDVLRADSRSAIMLLCEHAGRAVPCALDNLNVGDDVISSHRGWDIGAEELAHGLAHRLNAPLIVQRYSRLVIDCNRPPGGKQSMPEISDDAEITGNMRLSDAAKQARIDQIFTPLDQAIQHALNTPRLACFSIHSFTRTLAGVDRPWHAGFLTRRAPDTAAALIADIAARQPELMLAVNEPYQIDDETDWFIPQHAEKRDLPHCLIEVRNDQLRSPDGIAHWVDLLGHAIEKFMETQS